MPIDRVSDALTDPNFEEAVRRGIIIVADDRITYQVAQSKSYLWTDPEEWVRAVCLAWLVIDREYPANRIRTEVLVPRRTPSDHADIVVYRDDRCSEPYLVCENKADGQTDDSRRQGIEQLFGNANSLRVPLGFYDDGSTQLLFDIANYPSTERQRNRLEGRGSVPRAYGETPEYAFIAGSENDI